jgi:putative nucleotidyltransferase with HDIG domain
MKELKYIEKIRQEESLLSLPQSLSKILELVGSENFSMEDLGDTILNDPGLTGKILKMANSAFYRKDTEIRTVHQAVMMLGMIQVKCLALSASIFSPRMLKRRLHLNLKELFRHFISVAIGAKKIAADIGYESTEEAFIAGLLHDIGILFFIHHFPEDYYEVTRRSASYSSLEAAEKDILGVDHMSIGQMLAEKWHLPEELCNAIMYHHDSTKQPNDTKLADIVCLSVLINKQILSQQPESISQRLNAVSHLCTKLDIDRERLDEITLSLLNETIEIADYMGIDIGDSSEILARANKELLNSYLTIESLFRERQELSRRILEEERRSGAIESKNVAMATLSHYMSNATMAISGRAQLIKMLVENGAIIDQGNKLEKILEVLETSSKKIMAVLAEMRELNTLADIQKYSDSIALNIDDRIRQRMKMLDKEPSVVTPEPTKP